MKVNDIILHKNLGLMILVEEYPKKDYSNSFAFKLHGTPLFRMMRLMSSAGANESNTWTLHDSSLHKVRLATDDDIIEALTDGLCTIYLDDNITLSFNPIDESMCLSGDDSIYLTKSSIKLLKKYLKELNV